ncbi:MAG: hypothetical protein WBB94_02595 [Candidatus Saccharimonadaceae bacterium]
MAKLKKKRNKQYRGADAKSAPAAVTRVTAEERSRLKQWWIDRKPVLKPILIIVGVLVFVVWLIVEAIRLFSGG